MTTQQFWKGLFMLVITTLITGFSQTPINYALIGIAAVAAILPYVGKNLIAVLNSDSQPGTLSLVNIVSIILIGLGTALTNGLGQYFIEGQIIWPILWKVVIYTTGTYFLTTFFSPPNSTSKKLFT